MFNSFAASHNGKNFNENNILRGCFAVEGPAATGNSATHHHHHHHHHHLSATPAAVTATDTAITSTVAPDKKVAVDTTCCGGCGKQIKDRFLMKVDQQIWHERCLVCSCCGILLTQSCYNRNSKFYCKTDYIRMYSVRCSRCGDVVLPQDMVMKAGTCIYHVHCFACFVCCQVLKKGEQFVLRNGQLLCKSDFEKELHFFNDNLSSNVSKTRIADLETDEEVLNDPRTILTAAQRKEFKASFDLSPKPCRKVRENLAKDTGLTARVVQVWFQNQRAKIKKIQRKNKQDLEKNQTKATTKFENGTEKQIDKYLDLNMQQDSNDTTYTGVGHHQTLYRNNSYSSDGTYLDEHSGDTFYSGSDMSLDGSVNTDEIGSSNRRHSNSIMPIIRNTTIHSTAHMALCSGGSFEQVNPIDKLYLMQNSYFNTATNNAS